VAAVRLKPIILAVIAGVALVLSFAPFNVWPLTWIALAPLLVAYSGSNLRASLILTLITGVVFFGELMYWIGIFGKLPWILLALDQTLFILVFCAFAHRLMNIRAYGLRLTLIPACWVSLEWIRSLSPFGFTWGDLAQSQVHCLPLIQICSFTGPWGLAFLIVMVNVAIAEAFTNAQRRNRLRPTAIAAAVCLATFAYGWHAMSSPGPAGKKVSVAIIQGNIEQELRPGETWDEHKMKTIADYMILTAGALKSRPDLIVWPETAIPGYMSREDVLKDGLANISTQTSTSLLIGASEIAPSVDGLPREYNGAFLFSPGKGLAGNYYKTHLVPFGEVVYGRKWLPFLDSYKVRDIDYSSGPGYLPVNAGFADLGVMICFESIFPQIARKLSNQGADVLVVMTNDAWFERSAAAEQHFDMSILRAVENRRYVVRNAATGISGVIDPFGRVTDKAPIFTARTIRADVAVVSDKTLYTRLGDWFAYVCVAATLAGIFSGVARRKQTKKQASDA
jgi:apolipoprotein N-acyltransferase